MIFNFVDFNNESFNLHLISFLSLYPYQYLFYNPVKFLENQISKAFNSDVFKSVNFCLKINFNENKNNYFNHANLPSMIKDQVKMELLDDDSVSTISGKRKIIIDYSNEDSNKDSNK